MNGLILKTCRIMLELTQEELAIALGLSGVYITKLERGEKRINERLAGRLTELFINGGITRQELDILNNTFQSFKKGRVINE
jgi:Helix-turn-helix.